jgi:hypothetical protein
MREHIHKFQWYYLTFLSVIFVGLGFYYLVHFGFYPLAIVNGHLVSARSFNNEFLAAYQYYSRVLAGQMDVNSREFRGELRRATLAGLIQKSLISAELKEKVGDDLKTIVYNKIGAGGANTEALERAAQTVYGLSLADFKQMILIPQAEREVLEGRLFLEKKKLEDWLASASKNAKVLIVTPEFYWDAGQLIVRK